MTLKDATPPFVLSLDIGTSSVRAFVFDARGRRISGIGAREPLALRVSSDGAAEIDAAELFDAVARCLDGALAQSVDLLPPNAIAGVAVTTLAPTLVALDRDGVPLTPVFTYADTRCAQDAAALQARLDEREIHQRTGCLLRTSYWPAQLAWLRRTRPAIFRQAAFWATFGDYLELRFFGRRRISYSAASWTGLLDRALLSWDLRLLGELGIRPGQLASLVDRDVPIQGLIPEHTARWAELADVPWFPAIGDGAAASIGSGCSGPTRAALTVGTTGALRITLPNVAQVPAGLWCYRIDRHRALLGGATSEGGNVIAWLRDTLRIDEDPDVLDRAMSALPPDGHGLTILPFGGRTQPWLEWRCSSCDHRSVVGSNGARNPARWHGIYRVPVCTDSGADRAGWRHPFGFYRRRWRTAGVARLDADHCRRTWATAHHRRRTRSQRQRRGNPGARCARSGSG